jgi:hypothetical protein
MSAASRPCERPLWIRARLGRASEGVRWGVRLGRPLPAGRYRVLVKGVDRTGNGATLSSGRSTLVRVKR